MTFLWLNDEDLDRPLIVRTVDNMLNRATWFVSGVLAGALIAAGMIAGGVR